MTEEGRILRREAPQNDGGEKTQQNQRLLSGTFFSGQPFFKRCSGCNIILRREKKHAGKNNFMKGMKKDNGK